MKKTLCILLAFLMLLCALPVASAEDYAPIPSVSITAPANYLAGDAPDIDDFSVPQGADYFIRSQFVCSEEKGVEYHLKKIKSGVQYYIVFVLSSIGNNYFSRHLIDDTYWYSGTVTINGSPCDYAFVPQNGGFYSRVFNTEIENNDLIVIIPFIADANPNLQKEREEYELLEKYNLSKITDLTVSFQLDEDVSFMDVPPLFENYEITPEEGQYINVVYQYAPVLDGRYFYWYISGEVENGIIEWDLTHIGVFTEKELLDHVATLCDTYVVGTINEIDTSPYTYSKLPDYIVQLEVVPDVNISNIRALSYDLYNSENLFVDDNDSAFLFALGDDDTVYYSIINKPVEGKFIATSGTMSIEIYKEYYGVSYYPSYAVGNYTEHEHNYNIEKEDIRYFAANKTCQHGNIYYKSCECFKIGTETFEVGEKLDYHRDLDFNNICDDCGVTIYQYVDDDDADNHDTQDETLSFFEKIAEFFNKIMEWFKNLFA